jgi:hypothetical protein
MDQVDKIPELIQYGEELGRKILRDDVDQVQEILPQVAPARRD